MRIVETHDPEVMRLDDDSVLSRISGVAVLFAGIAAWAIYLRADSEPGRDADPSALLLIVGAGLVSAIVGLTMMLYEGQTIIDRRLGKVVHWQRFLWWRPKSEHSLEAFVRVAVVRSGTGRRACWSVELQTEPTDPAQTVLCGCLLTQTNAAFLAEQIAVFSGLATA